MKRHPTLEDGVIVGAGAQVLGDITVGKGARVGGNAVVIKSVPANSVAVGVPAQIVMPKECGSEFAAYGIPTQELPDPVARAIDGLLDQISRLQGRITVLENELDGFAAGTAGKVARHGKDQIADGARCRAPVRTELRTGWRSTRHP